MKMSISPTEAKVLKYLSVRNPIYATRISREIKVTFTHLVKVMKDLRECDLVYCETLKNRKLKKYYSLTDRGTKIVCKLNEMEEIMLR